MNKLCSLIGLNKNCWFYQGSCKWAIMAEGGNQKKADSRKTYIQKNPLMVQLSEKRRQLDVLKKRRDDPAYDAEYKKKMAEQKQRQRLRRKSGMKENEHVSEADNNIKVELEEHDDETENDENIFATPSRVTRRSGSLDNTMPSVLARLDNTPSPTSRQQDKGEQKRRQNRDEKNKEIDTLHRKLDESDMLIEEKNRQIQKLEAQLEKATNKVEESKETVKKSDDVLKHVYTNSNSDGKRQIREALFVPSPAIERGTILRLRKNIGLNFSIPPAHNDQVESETKVKIEKFAFQNTIDVPDKRKYIKGIRYRTASKLSLYECFDSQHPNLCTYQTFCKYWPRKYLKPKPSDLGTCMCIICQNAELKAEALKHHIGAEHSIETAVENARHNDFDAETAFKEALEKLIEDETKTVVGFSRWEKVKQTELSKNTGLAKSDKVMRQLTTEPANLLAESMLLEYEEYKEHLKRNSTIKCEIKAMILEALENGDIAVLHIDWAEQHKLSEIKEVQSAYFAGRFHYEIHTVYIYTMEDSHGAASISVTSDHRAEAVHVAIKAEIVRLVEKGKTTIVIVSDSPVSQYRNSKNVFLMRKLAMELGICIRLIFTESGHGKSPCDGVGGNIKTQVEEVLLKNYGENILKPIHSAEDVKEIIETKTNLTYDIKVHTAEEIKEVRDNMPKLGPLTRAFKIHEVLISSDGETKSKDLPSDVLYNNVKIKESRRPRRVEAVNVELEEEEDPEDNDSDE